MKPAAPVTRMRNGSGRRGTQAAASLGLGRRLGPAGRGRWRSRRSRARHARRVVEVAAVEDHRRLEPLADQVEVRRPERLPLGHDDERVGALQRRLLGAAEQRGRRGRRRGAAPPPSPRGRRPAPWRRRPRAPPSPPGRPPRACRRCCGLKARPQSAKVRPVEVAAVVAADLVEDHRLLRVVAVLDRLQQLAARSRPRGRCGSAPSRPWGSTSRRSRRPGR